MKVSFNFVLAFAVILLAVSAKSVDKPKAEPKLDDSKEKKEETPTSTENGDKYTSTISPEEKESSTTSKDMTTKRPFSESEEKRCNQMIGKFVNGVFQGLEVEYNGQKLLEMYGGAPGKVNATWTEKEDAPVEKEDLEKRPLPDADKKYWLYRYGDTDGKTYIRIEHAVRRFSGTPKAFLEVRGLLYFTPDDFCGKVRPAAYTLDDRGFTFELTYDYCWISDIVTCNSPASCYTDEKEDSFTCVASPSIGLLASLIGGGK